MKHYRQRQKKEGDDCLIIMVMCVLGSVGICMMAALWFAVKDFIQWIMQ